MVRSNEKIQEAVKISKKRVRSPHTYLKILGLYSKSNLLDEVLKMYKTSVEYTQSPPLISKEPALTASKQEQIDYYASLNTNSQTVNGKYSDTGYFILL